LVLATLASLAQVGHLCQKIKTITLRVAESSVRHSLQKLITIGT
jgi:hypothetical protein